MGVSVPWNRYPSGAPYRATVLDSQRHAVLPEQCLDLGPAATGEGDVLNELLGASHYPRSERRGQPHALLFVELRILKCRQPFDLDSAVATGALLSR